MYSPLLLYYDDCIEFAFNIATPTNLPQSTPRYSEFEDLRAKLAQTFPHAVGSMPQFPPKSIICKSLPSKVKAMGHGGSLRMYVYPDTRHHLARFRPKFLEKRKQGLSFFLK